MPLPFAQLQMRNEDNNSVQSGKAQQGRRQVPRQMRGERIVDGWVKTGDIGRLDANRYSTCSTAPTTW